MDKNETAQVKHLKIMRNTRVTFVVVWLWMADSYIIFSYIVNVYLFINILVRFIWSYSLSIYRAFISHVHVTEKKIRTKNQFQDCSFMNTKKNLFNLWGTIKFHKISFVSSLHLNVKISHGTRIKIIRMYVAEWVCSCRRLKNQVSKIGAVKRRKEGRMPSLNLCQGKCKTANVACKSSSSGTHTENEKAFYCHGAHCE